MKKIENFVLSNGVVIPSIGFGTWQIPNGPVAYQSTLDALKVGYRHIDTAAAYGNEESIGKAIKDSKIPRNEIFITSKLKAELKGYETALLEFQKTIDRLGVDYLDLYLIHAPKPWGSVEDPNVYNQKNVDTFRAFIKLYEEGKIRSIGVSNFHKEQIEPIIKQTGFAPHVNQIYLCPGTPQEETSNYCENNGILIEAYSPFSTGRLFQAEHLEELALKYSKTKAQVALRWSLQKGHLPLPKSTHLERIEENLDVQDFELDSEDMKLLDVLSIPR